MTAMTAPRDTDNKKAPARRFTTRGLIVNACTIGTKINFKMPVANVSASGMLLTWNEHERVPFSVSTILEVEVKSGDTPSSHYLAKVIHLTKQPDGHQRYGIKIIQAEDEDLQRWENVIKTLETTAQ